MDGEVVVVMPDGRSDFHALQSAIGSSDPRLVYYAFDLLELDGRSLSSLPLVERKAALRRLLPNNSLIRYSDHVMGHGEQFFEAARRAGAEGIVSKRARSAYRPGSRSSDWQKTKCVQRQEFVVGGYLSTPGAPLAALHLGYYDDAGDFRFAGKVGTGFQSVATDLLGRLGDLSHPSCPFASTSRPKGKDFREARWVGPELVVEVAFLEWTPDLHIRHPSFQGLRLDRDAKSVGAELPKRPAAGDPA